MYIPTNSPPVLDNNLFNCANDINEWLNNNNILLNTSKTTSLNISPYLAYLSPSVT